MPRYFLHLMERGEFAPDLEGVQQHDPASVRQMAMEGIGDLIADAVKKGDLDYRGRIDIEDEHGQGVLSLIFACAVQIEVKPFKDG